MAVTKISEEYRKKMSFHAKVEAVRLNLGLSPDFTMTDVIDEGMAYMGIIPESSWTGPQRLQALVEAMGLTFGEPPAACEHAALPAPAAAAASPAAKGAAEPRTVQAGNADASSSWPFRTKRVRGLCAAVEEVEERERKRRCSVEEADELRKEELRAVKQVIVDAIKAENEDKITKLQLQLVRTQKELEEAKANCQDAVEHFEDFANEIVTRSRRPAPSSCVRSPTRYPLNQSSPRMARCTSGPPSMTGSRSIARARSRTWPWGCGCFQRCRSRI